jgi:hypothetical protein
MGQAPVDGEYGSLVLSLATAEMSTRTIVPFLDMEIAYYEIQGDGPGPAAFSRSGVTGVVMVESSLVTGTWVITADAFNSAGYLIGTGSTAISITGGQITQAELRVAPLQGSGSLEISASWPPGTVANPSVSGSLTAAGGAPEDIPFIVDSDSAAYAYASLSAGYYSLTIRLWDGAVLKWGALEAVRILQAQTTEAVFDLTAEDINTGEIGLTIIPDMQNPIAIALAGQTSPLEAGTDMTVTATTSHDPVNTYQWYLDGAPLSGETTSSITIGGELPEGNYRLDLQVTKANVIGSQSFVFTVLPPTADLVYTNLSESGVELDICVYKGPEFDVYPSPLYTVWVEDMSGTFIQNLFVCQGVGTNEYPMSHNWAARPMAAPYWAHKCCIEDPYAGDPEHDTAGMYLALPTGAGGPPPYPVGPIPADLDAVTEATRLVDFHLKTTRKDDGVSQFRVLMEVQKAWDYNSYYDQSSYDLPGQPSLVYAAAVDTDSAQRLYTLSLVGAGHPWGSDGGLYETDHVTSAKDIIKKVLVYVRP